MRPTARAGVAAAIIPCVLVAVLTGCVQLSSEAQFDEELRSSVASAVADSQDVAWQFREELVDDPEAALPGVWGFVDARPALYEESSVPPRGSWLVLDVRTDAEGTALLLTASGGAETGGGWFYKSRESYTCYLLRISEDMSSISTEPASCPEGTARDPAEILGGGNEISFFSLDELDVRLHVDATDYESLPCQCSSGGDCDCPGG